MQLSRTEFCAFDWDDAKRLSNFLKHGIDFETAVFALKELHVEIRSDKRGEVRTQAICRDSGRIITVIYTVRGDVCRVISARPASKHERAIYHDSDAGRTS